MGGVKDRKEFGAVAKLTMESLRVSADEYSELPDDIGDGYVSGSASSTSISGEESFVIVWLTILLSQIDIAVVSN